MWLHVVTVTVVGVSIGALAWVASGRLVGPTVGGVIGAWGGFLIGALIGAAADVVAGSSGRNLTAGHVLAIVGATAATWREHELGTRQLAPRRRPTVAPSSIEVR